MNEQEKALRPEGAAKPAHSTAVIYVIDRRERLLVPLTFGFCLLLVNTLLTCGSGLGWASAVCAWYALVAVCKGRRLTATAESRFLLGTTLPLAAGTAGAVVLLAVLVPVLASADALFAAATADLRDFFTLHFTDAVWKAILAGVMTPFFFGLLYFLRQPMPLRRKEGPSRGGADSLAFAIVLAAAAALYLLFLGVQSAGLLGGAEYLARKHISYAEWARSGFFQMVGVTALNLTLLLAAVQWSRREGAAWRAVRFLSALLTAESLVLLASAAVRMTLYVEAYGLSFKRCMTYWGMGMMAAFLLAAAWKVRRPDFRFCRVAFPLALAGWLAINCVPVDYLVAKDQVDRYLAGESAALDAEYLLYDLSYDTLSQLERLDPTLVENDRPDLVVYDRNGYPAFLSVEIEARRAEAREDCADWRTWSLSAWLAARGGA